MSTERVETRRMVVEHPERPRADGSLKIVLWSVWALAVLGTAGWSWWLDVAAQRPVDLLGLSIYSLLAGIIGLLAMTLVEQWLAPHRFVD